MPTALGVNFGGEFLGGPGAVEKQGRKIHGKISLRIERAIFQIFCQIHPTSALQNLGIKIFPREKRLIKLNSAKGPIKVRKRPIDDERRWPMKAMVLVGISVGCLLIESGTEKAPQRNNVTKIVPNFRVNFLVRFASKALFCLAMHSNCSANCYWCCSRDVLACGFFWPVIEWVLFRHARHGAKRHL